MSTKNLSRTVIEGGRSRYNRFERRHSNALERTWERQLSARLLAGADPEEALYRRRPTVYAGFSDKLAPARRWLLRQVGRPWSKVRSELFARFDSRTTAGRHVLHDHLLRAVEGERFALGSRLAFRVDRRGLLQKKD